jgi:hypothetical protein
LRKPKLAEIADPAPQHLATMIADKTSLPLLKSQKRQIYLTVLPPEARLHILPNGTTE